MSRTEIIARYSQQEPTYWGLTAPGVVTHMPEGTAAIALTLDYCGGPGSAGVDHMLLEFLRSNAIPVTLFLNARWINANLALAKSLAQSPGVELANHGTRHLPLSLTGRAAYGIPGTRGVGAIYDEVMENAHLLGTLTGKPSRFFRSGTAHLDDVAASICHDLGHVPAGFSINADAGATFPSAVVHSEMLRARPGDIVIAHGNRPTSGTGTGLIRALPVLLDKGYSFTTLSGLRT